MEEIPESYYFVPADDAVAAQPDDPFNLTQGLDDGLEDLGLELSQYQQIDDDVAVAADTLPVSFDLAEPVEQDFAELSFYSQLDDDLAVAPDTLATLFDGILDDDVTPTGSDYFVTDDDVAVQPETLQQLFDLDPTVDQDAELLSGLGLSFYQQIDDDPAAVPETLIGSFDFIDAEAQFDDAASFYYQQDDDVIVVTPPVTTGGGGIAGTGRVHVLPSRQQDRATDRHHVDKREPFTPLREVKRAEKPASDLKALRDRLLDLGRALERNKQAVKDRIRVEQAKAESPELMAILQLLIDEYELTLYNQNAARLLIILADDR